MHYHFWPRMSDQFGEFSEDRVVLVFRAESPLSIVVWYRTKNGRRDGACTDETGTRRRGGREWWRIYVMKRSPGWSRAWDARTHVPLSFPMRDACQDGENKERESRESLSLSSWRRLVAPESLISRAAASRINGTGNMKQRARARTHYAHGREMRARVYHPQSFAKTYLSRDFHAARTVEAPRLRDATRQNIWDGFAPSAKGTNHQSFRETSSKLMFARSSKDYPCLLVKYRFLEWTCKRTFKTL